MSVDESTRVIVKNIPKHCDEKRLRAHFESISPDVTDVRVMKTKEGKSRCFGFIGFRSAEAASHCRAVSDRSYIDTSRISVEMARRYGDEDLARPWSRYSKGSSAYNKANPDEAADAGEPASRKGSDGGATSKVGKAAGNKADPLAARVHSDPKLAEFLQLMAPKSKQKQLWNNDLAAGPAEPSRQRTTPAGGKSATGAAAECEGEEDGEGEEDDDSEYEELPAALSGKETDAGDGGEDDEDEEEEATEGADGGGQREMSDLDYLKSKKRKWLEDDEEDEKDEEAREEEVAEENDEDEELEEELDEELDGIDADEEAEEAEEMDDGATAAVHGRGGAGAASTADAAASGDAAELAEHGRLFARNLPFSVSEDELREAFETFGEVAEIHVPMDTHTRRGKGFAYVRYATGEHAVAALAELDGSIFQGRILHLLPSRESAHEKKLRAADGAGDDKGSNYKDQKAASLKAKAQEGTNWNSLFMRPDAVGDAMAKRYGVAKSDFLDPSADSSMAVKLAQGETHLIAQSTAWLAEHGVSLEALQQAVQAGSGGGATGGATQRSKTLILVKNLSADVTEDEVATLFAKHGQLGSVLLTPSNTLALVEFLEVGEARRAFRSVAYTKVHGVPIYLEWAPVGVLEKNRADATAANGSSSGADGVAAAAEAGRTGLAAAKEKSGAAATGVAKAAVGQAAAAVAVGGDDVDADDTEGRTLFVKNLSFQSSQDDLLTLFSKRYAVRAATVVTKPDPKMAKKRLSMGYGFVEFKSAAHAQSALREMAGARLHEHVLQLKLSSRTSATGAASKDKGKDKGKDKKAMAKAAGTSEPSPKLIVRNLPFQANQKEIKELFQTFGQLKTVRLPKKFDGHHRGFAFVEFVSKAESTKAMTALQATHLYGRHLVLEYAEEERSVEAMREKLRAQQATAGDHEATAPKRKRRKGEIDQVDDLDL